LQRAARARRPPLKWFCIELISRALLTRQKAGWTLPRWRANLRDLVGKLFALPLQAMARAKQSLVETPPGR
jgi:hypothetical protein